MPSLKHLHTYERIKDRKMYFRCIHPVCYHFIHQNMLLNKRAMCRCGDEFEISREELQKDSLKCPNCIKTRNRKSSTPMKQHEISTVVKDLLSELEESDKTKGMDKSYEL